MSLFYRAIKWWIIAQIVTGLVFGAYIGMVHSEKVLEVVSCVAH